MSRARASRGSRIGPRALGAGRAAGEEEEAKEEARGERRPSSWPSAVRWVGLLPFAWEGRQAGRAGSQAVRRGGQKGRRAEGQEGRREW